ncbi:restriction endonuclease subunit S [Antrihabitans spumae]|uniref:Restriction endonuclease subunit S n=1 Tax=Antrihabitans spumae TaxID=3373370 RepID=A0ABW7K4M1_9NOCA
MDEYCRLGEVVTIQRGTTYKSALLGRPGPVLLGLGSIQKHGGFRGEKLKTYGGESPDNLLVHPGEVYASLKDVTQTADLLGSVAMVPKGSLVGRLTQDTVRLCVIDSRFSVDYVHWMLRTPEYREHCRGHATGTTTMGLARDDFFAFKIPIPTRSTVALIELLVALDAKIGANERSSQLALELADAMFLSAERNSTTRHTIGELAERSILEYGDGYRTKRLEHGQPGLRILRAGDVRGLQCFADGDDFVSKGYIKQIGAKRSQTGDVVMTTKGTVGRVAVVSKTLEPVVYSPQVCYFRVKDEAELHPAYLAAWFRSADRKAQSEMVMYKSDMAPYINLNDIRSLRIPILARSEMHRAGTEQRALLDQFDASCAENAVLARTRDELLPRLMSGEIKIKDAETAADVV